MALALCHTLPRDNWLRSTFFVALVAFLVIVAGLSAALDDISRWGTLIYEDPHDLGSFRKLAILQSFDIRPWQSDDVEATTKRMCPRPSNAADSVALRFGSAADYSVNFTVQEPGIIATTGFSSCVRFADSGLAAVIILYVTAFGLLLLVFLSGCVVMRLERNTRVVVGFTLAWLPSAVCAVVGTSTYAGAMLAAVDFAIEQCERQQNMFVTGRAPKCDKDHIYVSSGVTFNCAIVGTCWIGLGLFMCLWKLYQFRKRNNELKEEVKARSDELAKTRGLEGDDASNDFSHTVVIEDRLELRIVNDDWERQKQILEQRRHVVGALLRDIKRHQQHGSRQNSRPNTPQPEAQASARGDDADIRKTPTTDYSVTEAATPKGEKQNDQ